MSETSTPFSEPSTGPVATPPPAQAVVRDEPRRSKVTAAAAWVGLVAGVVFIVAVIFFSGFVLGTHSGGHRGLGGHKGDDGFAVIHRGPPPMFPMGPPGGFERPGSSGPGGPRFEPPQSGQPDQPGQPRP
jgi:hypothetical protein